MGRRRTPPDGPEVHLGGAGEDISFDVELARRFGATCVLVDPTPRALAHIEGVLARAGQAAEASFGPTGNQPVEAYDLTGGTVRQLPVIASALHSDDRGVTFAPPPIADHVSYRIPLRPEAPTPGGGTIRVDSVTLPSVTAEHGRSDLVKLNIEGAECGVLDVMLSDGVLPGQIIVALEALRDGIPGALRTARTIWRLRRNGYRIARTEDLKCTFVRRNGEVHRRGNPAAVGSN